MPETQYYTHYESPVGTLLLTSDGEALTGLHLRPGDEDHSGPGWVEDSRPFTRAIAELDDYFAGQLQEFTMPLRLDGTAFQRKVWKALRGIPYGETVSYAEIARRVGQPTACRAVGTANGRNPVAIVVPCHRVIAADGTLGGYGGGLDRKRFLLALETRGLADGGAA